MGQAIRPQEYFLRKGYIYIPRVPTLIATVLGTGVAVCIWDRKRKKGGMNHFLYPETKKRSESTPRFGNVAVYALLRFICEDGSKLKNLEAQIFGGAAPENCTSETRNIARENVQIARRMLIRYGVKITAEDTGGRKGRKIIFNTYTNEVAIMHVERIRKEDWYPYEGDR